MVKRYAPFSCPKLGELLNSDDIFVIKKVFELKVPKNYVHKEAFGKNHKLIPGRSYTIKIYEVKHEVRLGYCFQFLQEKRAMFVGEPGLDLIWRQKWREFPEGEKLVGSFDGDMNFYLGNRFFPLVSKCSVSEQIFLGGRWTIEGWRAIACLLCVLPGKTH